MQNHQKPDTRYRILTFKNMSFAFDVLAIGLGLAIFAFAGQIVHCKWINMAIRNRKNVIENETSIKSDAYPIIEETSPIIDDDFVGNEEKGTGTPNEGKGIHATRDVGDAISNKIHSDEAIETAIEEIKENVSMDEVNNRRSIDADIGIKKPKSKKLPNLDMLVVADIETFEEPKKIAINAMVTTERVIYEKGHFVIESPITAAAANEITKLE